MGERGRVRESGSAAMSVELGTVSDVPGDGFATGFGAAGVSAGAAGLDRL